MTIKFSSKEIHFLKPDSDDVNVKTPETYFSDLLLNKTVPVNVFEKRLSKAKISGEKFLCAVIRIYSDESHPIQEKAKETLKQRLTHFWIIKEAYGND